MLMKHKTLVILAAALALFLVFGCVAESQVPPVNTADTVGNSTNATNETGEGPMNPGIMINDGATYTTSADVMLSLSASGASECRFSGDGSSWGAWEAYSTTKNWKLEGREGINSVSFQCRDSEGKTSGPASASIYLKLTPLSISVSSPAQGGSYSRDVEFAFMVSGEPGAQITCTAKLDGILQPAGIVEAGELANVTVELLPGNHTAEIECSDGMLSATKSVSFSVIGKPQISSMVLGDGLGYADTITTSLDINASNAAECRFANGKSAWSEWKPYAAAISWALEPGIGPKNVSAQCRNSAGEESDVFLGSVNLDNAPPPYISVEINRGNEKTESIYVDLALYSFAADQCRFSEDNSTWTDWEPYVTKREFELSREEGTKTVYYECKRTGGEGLGVASDDIEYEVFSSSSGPIRT